MGIGDPPPQVPKFPKLPVFFPEWTTETPNQMNFRWCNTSLNVQCTPHHIIWVITNEADRHSCILCLSFSHFLTFLPPGQSCPWLCCVILSFDCVLLSVFSLSNTFSPCDNLVLFFFHDYVVSSWLSSSLSSWLCCVIWIFADGRFGRRPSLYCWAVYRFLPFTNLCRQKWKCT